MAGGLLGAFGLLVCQLPSLAVAVAIGSMLVARYRWPATTMHPAGRLLFFADKLVLVAGTRQMAFPLLPATRIIIHYRGYANERLGPRAYASGHDNSIQLADGPVYHFTVANEAAQSTLRAELKNWYLRRVGLQEYRLGNRTLLLYAALTYEQLQRYKQELGVALYGGK